MRKTIKGMKLLIGVALFFWITDAMAEMYRYVGPDGVVRYTDNLQMVPEHQRSAAQRIQEVHPVPSKPSQSTDMVRSDIRKVEPSDDGLASGVPAAGNLADEMAALKKEQMLLEQEYVELLRMNLALKEKRAAAQDQASIKDYNVQVMVFNQKSEDYEIRRKALQQKIDAIEQKIRSQLDPPNSTEIGRTP